MINPDLVFEEIAVLLASGKYHSARERFRVWVRRYEAMARHEVLASAPDPSRHERPAKALVGWYRQQLRDLEAELTAQKTALPKAVVAQSQAGA